jgi:hypothetical protein
LKIGQHLDAAVLLWVALDLVLAGADRSRALRRLGAVAPTAFAENEKQK